MTGGFNGGTVVGGSGALITVAAGEAFVIAAYTDVDIGGGSIVLTEGSSGDGGTLTFSGTTSRLGGILGPGATITPTAVATITGTGASVPTADTLDVVVDGGKTYIQKRASAGTLQAADSTGYATITASTTFNKA